MSNKFAKFLCFLYLAILFFKKLETEYAKKNEIPYMVSIRIEDTSTEYGHHICDGVITDKEIIVTAAHCLIVKGGYDLIINDTFIIVAGPVHRTGSEIRKSKNIFIHPKFDIKTKRHNLALIALNTPLPLDNKTIKSIELAKTEFQEGTQCIISGWRPTFDNLPDQIQKSKVYIMPKDECVADYAKKNYEITNEHICVGVPNGTIESCYGDTGGPLVCNDFLYGISSFDFECGLQNFPSIYSNVKKYKGFIEAGSDFDAYLKRNEGNYKFDFTQYYRSALFTLVLFVMFVLCALYFNTYK